MPRKNFLYVRGSWEKINSFRKFPPPPQIINGRPLRARFWKTVPFWWGKLCLKGTVLLKRVPFFKTVHKGHCFESVFFLSAEYPIFWLLRVKLHMPFLHLFSTGAQFICAKYCAYMTSALFGVSETHCKHFGLIKVNRS